MFALSTVSQERYVCFALVLKIAPICSTPVLFCLSLREGPVVSCLGIYANNAVFHVRG